MCINHAIITLLVKDWCTHKGTHHTRLEPPGQRYWFLCGPATQTTGQLLTGTCFIIFQLIYVLLSRFLARQQPRPSTRATLYQTLAG